MCAVEKFYLLIFIQNISNYECCWFENLVCFYNIVKTIIRLIILKLRLALVFFIYDRNNIIEYFNYFNDTYTQSKLVKSNRNQIVFTSGKNGKYNLNSINGVYNLKRFPCEYMFSVVIAGCLKKIGLELWF